MNLCEVGSAIATGVFLFLLSFVLYEVLERRDQRRLAAESAAERQEWEKMREGWPPELNPSREADRVNKGS